MEAASPTPLPAYTLRGMTPGDEDLTARAADSRSSHVRGCQLAGSPAFRSRSLLNQTPRVSVPSGIPYVLPSRALAAPLAVSTNWLQSDQPLILSSSGSR